jgi:hypothetical protein
MVERECEEHDYQILDVVQVVGWTDDDVAIPIKLETWQCANCGDLTETEEDYLDEDYELDIMTE